MFAQTVALELAAKVREAIAHNGSAEHPCTECGHHGHGQVPGCTCPGCDDMIGRARIDREVNGRGGFGDFA